MTLEQLSHNYFHNWLSGEYNEGEFMGKASHLSTMFIDEARSLVLLRMKISWLKLKL